MAIVYRHRRLDTNKIFYIGIGVNDKRAYQTRSRNSLWKNIVNKSDYSVEILTENIPPEDAKELEVFLISLYGRKDIGSGELSNMTEGGDGNTNMSIDQKNRISKSLTGLKQSEETKLKRKISSVKAWEDEVLRNKQKENSTRLWAEGKMRKCKGYNYSDGKFMVRICINGVRKYIGLFSTEEEAAEAYNKAKKEKYENK